MVTQSDLIMLGLAILIGFIDDANSPKPYHYENKIVVVDKTYQCPTYCGVNHHHSVYFESESSGMIVDKSKLGKRVKEKKTSGKNKR